MTTTDAPLAKLFAPRGIAVFGASSVPDRVGGRPLAFLLRAAYEGRIFPINPKSSDVQGLPSYPSLEAVDGDVDVAVIALAASNVPSALEQCIVRRVPYVIVFSAGLGESGASGRSMETQLAARARAAGVRVIGPNSLGAFCPATRVYATFATALDHAVVRSGRIAIATQSGAFGSYCFALAAERGLGLSAFAATGNESDVDVADLIEHFSADPGTDVVVAALEGCRDGGGLSTALRRARAARKPVVVMKTGASAAGQRAAASHTGSLAGEDAAFRAFFRANGAWQCDDLEHFVDVAEASAGGRFPAGRRIGVITTSGGIGVLLADAASQAGLELPPLSDAVQTYIRSILPLASGANPVDTSAQILNDMSLFERMLDATLESGAFDALVIYLAHIGRNPSHWAALREPLLAARRKYPAMPMVLCMLSRPEVESEMRAAGFIVQPDPTRAVRTIGALAFFGASLGRAAHERSPESSTIPPRWSGTPDEHQACEWLRANGVPMVAASVVHDAEAAAAALEKLGRPAALKILSADIAHKSDVGGVVLDLRTPAEARIAYARMVRDVVERVPQARIEGVLVAPMERGGIEVIVGTRSDPVLGPMLVFGLGGTAVEAVHDIVLRPAPVDLEEARTMIGELRASRLLLGFRGQPSADIEALAAVLKRMSELAVQYSVDIDAIEINPLLVRAHGVLGLDALVTLRDARP